MNKNMNRKAIAFLLVVLLALGSAPAVFADEIVSSGPTTGIIYKGQSAVERWLYQNVDTTYTSTDLFRGFKGVMPGDTLHQKFIVKNESGKNIKLFLEVLPHGEGNEISKGVRTTTPQMIAFLNQFSMEITAGDKALFYIPANPDNNPEVKGLGVYSGRQELGILAAGSAATLDVRLIVPLAMGNAYALDLANGAGIGEVDFRFIIEEQEPGGGGGDTPSPDDPDNPKEEPDEPDTPVVIPGEPVEDVPNPENPLGDAPKTGDTARILPLVLLMLAALAGMIVTRKKLN